jgi:hypothetical protein
MKKQEEEESEEEVEEEEEEPLVLTCAQYQPLHIKVCMDVEILGNT